MSKYIIDVGDAYIRHGLERTLTIPVRINEHEDHWMDTRIPVTPYTEPDIEKIREEAYEDGYKTAKVQCNIQAEKDLREVGERHYQKGLSDAWAAARKLWDYDLDTLKEIFGWVAGKRDVFIIYTAAEAIEKIRQYEQEKEEQITKGDIVLIKSTPEVEILVTFADEEYVSGIALTEVDGNCEIGDQYTNIRISNVENTGKHYDIVSVLQKMKETDNG